MGFARISASEACQLVIRQVTHYTGLVNTGIHEEAHTYQAEVLGPLFYPFYFMYGGISKINPFENAADNYYLGGPWWPVGRWMWQGRP